MAPQHVCPSCGEPPGAASFCGSCGLNLNLVARLPTREQWESKGVDATNTYRLDDAQVRGIAKGRLLDRLSAKTEEVMIRVEDKLDSHGDASSAIEAALKAGQVRGVEPGSVNAAAKLMKPGEPVTAVCRVGTAGSGRAIYVLTDERLIFGKPALLVGMYLKPSEKRYAWRIDELTVEVTSAGPLLFLEFYKDGRQVLSGRCRPREAALAIAARFREHGA